jgi:hypothetical protein
MSVTPSIKTKRRTPMADQRMYRTFEEFEREELRRDGYFESVDEMIDGMFAGELDFGDGQSRRAGGRDDDEEE